MVLAGGEGKRLQPLTRDRAKPAVPFGGDYRLIDFALSNLANGGFLRIVVLTQYKSHSLDVHLAKAWRMAPILGNYVISVPAQMRQGPHWFAGSADAVYQNLNLIRDERPDHVIVFGADHIYRMDPRQMVAAARGQRDRRHRGGDPDAAGAGRPVRRHRDGARTAAIARFREKPKDATGLPDAPDQVYASMGNYVFTTAGPGGRGDPRTPDPDSRHDIGGDIIPALVDAGRPRSTTSRERGARAPPTGTGATGGTWGRWTRTTTPTWTWSPWTRSSTSTTTAGRSSPPGSPMPPAKFVFADPGRTGHAIDSMVSAGVVVSGGRSGDPSSRPGVFVHSYADGGGLRPHAQRGRGPERRGPQRHHRQERAHPAGRAHRRGPGARPRPLHVTEQGIVVIGKDDEVQP
jgi:glucose-1-phosphate adenylyltransferase